MADSFSPGGEALFRILPGSFFRNHLQVTAKGFSLEGEAVKNRLFGTDF